MIISPFFEIWLGMDLSQLCSPNRHSLIMRSTSTSNSMQSTQPNPETKKKENSKKESRANIQRNTNFTIVPISILLGLPHFLCLWLINTLT